MSEFMNSPVQWVEDEKCSIGTIENGGKFVSRHKSGTKYRFEDIMGVKM